MVAARVDNPGPSEGLRELGTGRAKTPERPTGPRGARLLGARTDPCVGSPGHTRGAETCGVGWGEELLSDGRLVCPGRGALQGSGLVEEESSKPGRGAQKRGC